MQPGTFLKMFIFLLANFHLQLFPQIVDGVCWPNNDNRQLVDVPAIGRIVTIYNGVKIRWGTATILNTGLLISARHVWADIESVNLKNHAFVEFNIRVENGVEIVDPEDIYLIDVPTLRVWSDAAEQDIITFEVYPNEITGIFPRTKQNDFLFLNLYLPLFGQGVPIGGIAYGYGLNDDPELNYQLQKSSGLITEHLTLFDEENLPAGSKLHYTFNTSQGFSGGPILYGSSIVGIISRSECPKGYNVASGLRDMNSSFYTEITRTIYNPVTLKQVKHAASDKAGKLFRWITPLNSPAHFKEHSNGNTYHLKLNSLVTVRADTNVIDGEKISYWIDSPQHRHIEAKTNYSTLTNFTAVLEEAMSTKIQTRIDGFEVPGFHSIQFSDPWFRDQMDQQFGEKVARPLNQTYFYEETSPLLLNFNVQNPQKIYKGVLKNKGSLPFWNPPYYKIKSLESREGLNPQTGKFHRTSFLNWSSDTPGSAEIRFPYDAETAISFKEDNSVINAEYKGTELSGNPVAYANNSQRKVFSGTRVISQTEYPYFISLYESMGRVYGEYIIRDNDGVTYSNLLFLTSGYTYSTDALSKSPAIDFAHPEGADRVFAYVFQEQIAANPNASRLRVVVQQIPGTAQSIEEWQFLLDTSFDVAVPYETATLNPVITIDDEYAVTIVWEVNANSSGVTPGLYAKVYKIDINQLNSPESSISLITGTNENSNTPSLSGEERATRLDLVYEQTASASTSSVYWIDISKDDLTLTFSSPVNISSGSGYAKNSNPSVVTLEGNYARVVWRGFRQYLMEEEEFQKQQAILSDWNVVFKSTDNPSMFWTFGTDVASPSINKRDNNTYYAFSWTQNSGNGGVKLANNTLSSIYTLSHKYAGVNYPLQGTAVQMANGISNQFMHAHTFNGSGTGPYVFRYSNPVSSLSKEQNLVNGKAREGSIFAGNTQFYFTFGNLQSDGVGVEFVEIPDTTRLSGTSESLQYLQSQPFQISGNSKVSYSVQYGIADSTGLDELMNNGGQVRFRAEIFDAATGEVLLTTDNVLWNTSTIINYRTNSYTVSSGSAGNRLVQIRLVIETNLPVQYTISDKLSEEGVFLRQNVKEVEMLDNLKITDFALTQNYPNPFNPVTEIEFALPEQSDITLKVYDILGKEILTLASGNYSAGRYTVPFDGTSHASGIYIYKLSYGKGQSITRKMTLLK